MAYIKDEIGRSVGLPKVIGGLPLDELGMTGYGVAIAADVASEKIKLPLKGARVVIQGFGNVGKAAAKYLLERGAKIIATCNSKGAICNLEGLDIAKLNEVIAETHSVQDWNLGHPITHKEMLELESDIFIPAARPDVFDESNQHLLKTKLVLEGANIPLTAQAARMIHDRGITIVPDVIANGGGVICAASEYQGMSEAQAYERVKASVSRNTEEVLNRVREEKLYPHDAARLMARERIFKAMQYRGHM
jgi:glutamate dehydrogenase/leucine dehydrogenase